MAGKAILRYFQPTIIIMEKTSQMTGSMYLNAIDQYYGSLQNAILSDDPNQLALTVVLMYKNECYESKKLSLMERLIKAGYPHIKLRVQHRMHPDIAELVSCHFYDNELRNHRSCSGRQPAILVWFAKLTSRPTCLLSDHPISQMAQPGS